MVVYINEYGVSVDLEENRKHYNFFYEKVWYRINATAGDWIEVGRDDNWISFIDKVTIEDDDGTEFIIYVEGEYDYNGECGMVLGPYYPEKYMRGKEDE